MKPYPLASLNHFTVPCSAMLLLLATKNQGLSVHRTRRHPPVPRKGVKTNPQKGPPSSSGTSKPPRGGGRELRSSYGERRRLNPRGSRLSRASLGAWWSSYIQRLRN